MELKLYVILLIKERIRYLMANSYILTTGGDHVAIDALMIIFGRKAVRWRDLS